MIKTVYVLLLVCLATHVTARDIYVYNNLNVVKTVKDVRKISFADGLMKVEQQGGTVVSLNLLEFNNFSFYEKKDLTLIHSLLAEGVDFNYDGKYIRVNKADVISVYSALGTELTRQDIHGRNVQISTENYPIGVYFVKVVAAGKTFTQKIYKK